MLGVIFEGLKHRFSKWETEDKSKFGRTFVVPDKSSCIYHVLGLINIRAFVHAKTPATAFRHTEGGATSLCGWVDNSKIIYADSHHFLTYGDAGISDGATVLMTIKL